LYAYNNRRMVRMEGGMGGTGKGSEPGADEIGRHRKGDERKTGNAPYMGLSIF
jgi:hypothetical protein